MRTHEGNMLPAFGGEFQPGLYKPVEGRKFANPAPLGLSAFALTTFVLSLLNLNTRNLAGINSIVIGLAFAFGGTALSSYGGFWISFAITLSPGGFEILSTIESEGGGVAVLNSLGFYLMGWFIFTFLLLICTLKSTVAFFFLFFTLDLAFLLLGIAYLRPVDGAPSPGCTRAGGAFGILAAF